MAFPIGAIIGAISIFKPLIAGKVRSAAQDESTGTVAVTEKPWWQSRAMLGAAALLTSFAGRYFGYELTGTSIDQLVEMALAIFVMIGRAKAVK